jgi:hypothetical protein
MLPAVSAIAKNGQTGNVSRIPKTNCLTTEITSAVALGAMADKEAGKRRRAEGQWLPSPLELPPRRRFFHLRHGLADRQDSILPGNIIILGLFSMSLWPGKQAAVANPQKRRISKQEEQDNIF